MKIESFETFLILHSDYELYDNILGTLFITNNKEKWLILNTEDQGLGLYCVSAGYTINSKVKDFLLKTKDEKEVHALLMQYLENMKDENWLI